MDYRVAIELAEERLSIRELQEMYWREMNARERTAGCRLETSCSLKTPGSQAVSEGYLWQTLKGCRCYFFECPTE